jgi:hypothetical protein
MELARNIMDYHYQVCFIEERSFTKYLNFL